MVLTNKGFIKKVLTIEAIVETVTFNSERKIECGSMSVRIRIRVSEFNERERLQSWTTMR